MIQDAGVEPKVSVVIPTYNRADNLSVTLSQLLRQTLARIEIVVVDDGSSDHTAKVAEGTLDKRVRYFKRAHVGMPQILIEGVREARGDYIMFCHDHDIYADDMLEQMAGALDRYPTAAFVHCGILVVAADGSRIVERFLRDYPDFMRGEDFLRVALLPNLDSHVTALTMVRRSVIERHGIDTHYEQCADVELWLRLCTIGDVAYIKKPLITVRQRDTTSQMYHIGLRLALLVLEAKRKYLSHINDHGLQRQIRRKWKRDMDRTALWAYLRALESRRPIDKRVLLDFSARTGTTIGRLATRIAVSLPKPVALSGLRWLRAFSRSARGWVGK